MSWSVYLYKSKVWTSESSFPNPNAVEFQESIESTSTAHRLVDGSLSYTQPETTYNLGAITFTWQLRKTTTIGTRIDNYIKSGSGLKLVTHTGKEFIGKFSRFLNRWRFSGATTQKYDLEVEFQEYEEAILRNQGW